MPALKVNKDNPMGSKGQIAGAFATLQQALWQTTPLSQKQCEKLLHRKCYRTLCMDFACLIRLTIPSPSPFFDGIWFGRYSALFL